MRSPGTVVLALLLAALGVSVADIEPQLIEKGHFAEITVVTFPNTATKCYLVTPLNTEINVLDTAALPDKYEYDPNTLSTCRVIIKDLDQNDEGLWTLHAVIQFSNGTEYEDREQAYVLIKESDTSDVKTSSVESSEISAEDDTVSASNQTSEEDKNTSSTEDLETSQETTSQEAISQETTSQEASSQETISQETKSQEATSEETTSQETKSQEAKSQESKSQETISQESTSQEAMSSQESKSLETISQETTSQEATSQEATSQEATSQEATSQEATSQETKSQETISQETTSEEKTSHENESSEASSSEEKAVETQWLSDLQYITRTGLDVDINMPPTLNSEKCTLTTPDGTTVDVGDGIPGVTAHGASEYVSCRVVVGPMEASLLGKWTLCGSYEENNVEHRRCQNTEIVWRSTSNPESMWQTTINAKFDHVVHFGGTLTPAVRGSGTVVSCHLVTPANEDLVVTRDREYPNVILAQDTDSACSIAIGPIANSHLGDWTVYGTFNSALWGYNEVRQPFNMELYNKDNPYEQAYNVTTLNPTQHVVNLGSTIPVEVASSGSVDSCLFTMPSGQTYVAPGTLPVGVSLLDTSRVACILSIGPITEDMIGDWLLVGKFSNRDVYTENRLTFTIIQEDPANPIEEDRIVNNLEEQFIDTAIGASHRLVIASDIFATFESCHIRTPEGLQYTIMEGFYIPGVEVVTGSGAACGVTLEVSEDLIGTWTLIAREIRSSQATERRLPFTIYVEESVEAVPNEITITEGNSIHVRLANPTDLHETCKLKDPNDQLAELGSSDENQKETCGFVVSSVDASHSGTWNIVYGTKIIYKAPVLVNVNAREDTDVIHLIWEEHASVSLTLGPEDAVYCQVTSPLGDVVFDGFRRCYVALDRVTSLHSGVWTMQVGLPGSILTENHLFVVKVEEKDKKPEVISSVLTNKPTVELTCSVTSAQQKTGCLFRDPTGKVLVANQGVSEGRYVFHVNQTSIESEGYFYSCGLQITEPATSDLGLWRCDLEAEEENFYGFLTVLCPWAMQDPNVAEAVVSEPVLKATMDTVSVDERDSGTMLCAARAPLRYCYFRAPNGTIYNIQPGVTPAGTEYVGAGLDAGECGIRVESLLHGDSGQWSCHAAIGREEQSHPIAVYVLEEFVVTSSRSNALLVVEGQVGGFRSLEYCRFVRFDGFGFTSDNAPFPYEDQSELSSGLCRLRVAFSALDLNPWTVVAKLQGRHDVISRRSGHNWPDPYPIYYSSLYMWLPLVLIMTGCVMLAGAFAPAKNRRWAAARASQLRTSMRDSLRRFPSLRRKPLPTLNDTNPAA